MHPSWIEKAMGVHQVSGAASGVPFVTANPQPVYIRQLFPGKKNKESPGLHFGVTVGSMWGTRPLPL